MCVSSVVLFSERLGTGRCLPRIGKKIFLLVQGTGIFHRLAESLSLHFETTSYTATHVQTN